MLLPLREGRGGPVMTTPNGDLGQLCVYMVDPRTSHTVVCLGACIALTWPWCATKCKIPNTAEIGGSQRKADFALYLGYIGHGLQIYIAPYHSVSFFIFT